MSGLFLSSQWDGALSIQELLMGLVSSWCCLSCYFGLLTSVRTWSRNSYPLIRFLMTKYESMNLPLQIVEIETQISKVGLS